MVRFFLFTCLIICLLSAICNGADLTASFFQKEVVKDERVWLIEFYSPMCGSCQEFAVTWDKIGKSMGRTISLGKINIDHKDGLKLAEEMGVLEEGIPNLRVFTKSGDKLGISIPIDESIKTQYKHIVDEMREKTKDLAVDPDGKLWKNSDIVSY